MSGHKETGGRATPPEQPDRPIFDDDDLFADLATAIGDEVAPSWELHESMPERAAAPTRPPERSGGEETVELKLPSAAAAESAEDPDATHPRGIAAVTAERSGAMVSDDPDSTPAQGIAAVGPPTAPATAPATGEWPPDQPAGAEVSPVEPGDVPPPSLSAAPPSSAQVDAPALPAGIETQAAVAGGRASRAADDPDNAFAAGSESEPSVPPPVAAAGALPAPDPGSDAADAARDGAPDMPRDPEAGVWMPSDDAWDALDPSPDVEGRWAEPAASPPGAIAPPAEYELPIVRTSTAATDPTGETPAVAAPGAEAPWPPEPDPASPAATTATQEIPVLGADAGAPFDTGASSPVSAADPAGEPESLHEAPPDAIRWHAPTALEASAQERDSPAWDAPVEAATPEGPAADPAAAATADDVFGDAANLFSFDDLWAGESVGTETSTTRHDPEDTRLVVPEPEPGWSVPRPDENLPPAGYGQESTPSDFEAEPDATPEEAPATAATASSRAFDETAALPVTLPDDRDVDEPAAFEPPLPAYEHTQPYGVVAVPGALAEEAWVPGVGELAPDERRSGSGEYAALAREMAALEGTQPVTPAALTVQGPGMEQHQVEHVGFDDLTGVAPAAGVAAERAATGQPQPRRRTFDREVVLRTATGIGIAVVALLLALAGPALFLGLVTIGAILAIGEYYSIIRRAKFKPLAIAGLAGTPVMLILAYNQGKLSAIVYVLSAVVAVTIVWFVTGNVRGNHAANAGATILGFLLIAVPCGFVAVLLSLPDYKVLVLGPIALVVVADVGAWLVGRRLGAHRLAPRVSPGKTWEGAVAGGLLAIAGGLVLGEFAPIEAAGGIRTGLLLGVVAAVVAPLGDLAQSMVKRAAGVKDTSSILPGHGGVWDRIDAMLFVLPTAYWVYRAVDVIVTTAATTPAP